MRIGIIGTGRHGSRYANHLVHDVDGLDLVAISRRSAKGGEQAAAWECRWFADWRELIAWDQVDAVISVVPPALNPDIARACARAGKPLLLEKPLAVSSEAGRKIVDHFRRQNLGLTIGQTLRYNRIIRAFRRELPSLGRLYSISANQRIEPSTLSWHEEPQLAGAGVSFHTAVHVFDALRFITGLEFQRVTAVSRRHHNSRLEDLMVVLFVMDQGVVGTLDCSKVGHARSGLFEFVCEHGQLRGDQVHGQCEIIRQTTRTSLEADGPVHTIVPLLKDWHRYLSGAGENPVSGEEGLASVRICEAVLRSAATEQWLTV